MSNKIDKVSYKELVIRIDERLQSLISKVDDLCKHVNHEMEKMDNRVCELEKEDIRQGMKLKYIIMIVLASSGFGVGISKLIELLL